MKEHCVDLEIAKELKENKFPQESFWCYYFCNTLKGIIWNFGENNRLHAKISKEICSAPASDEILIKLPNEIIHNNNIFNLTVEKYLFRYEVQYIFLTNPLNGTMNNIFFEDEKLSNALAKLWIYCKKEGYIK